MLAKLIEQLVAVLSSFGRRAEPERVPARVARPEDYVIRRR